MTKSAIYCIFFFFFFSSETIIDFMLFMEDKLYYGKLLGEYCFLSLKQFPHNKNI